MYLQVPEVSLTVNGHMALELAIQAFGFPEGAEVITTPYTFISTTHAIVRNKLQPVFCDIKEIDGTIDENKIESLITDKTVAIIPVHVYGNVCAVDEIQRIAKKYNLKVIYDAAHAFGEKYEEEGIGNYGDASIFSFHATKVFNTIEGGAVVCRTHDLYERLRDLKNFGIRGEELVTSVGANAKMNEFAAIMGLCNLKHINDAIGSRKRCYEYYMNRLSELPDVRFLQHSKNQTYNYAYLPIICGEKDGLLRNKLYDYMRENEIYPRKYFYPITADQKCFDNKYKDEKLERARTLSRQVLLLPLFEELEFSDIDRVIDCIVHCGGAKN